MTLGNHGVSLGRGGIMASSNPGTDPDTVGDATTCNHLAALSCRGGIVTTRFLRPTLRNASYLAPSSISTGQTSLRCTGIRLQGCELIIIRDGALGRQVWSGLFAPLPISSSLSLSLSLSYSLSLSLSVPLSSMGTKKNTPGKPIRLHEASPSEMEVQQALLYRYHERSNR